MNIGKALKFIFEDKNWAIKVLTAAGIFISAGLTFSLTFLFIIGYGFRITKGVIAHDPEPLPAWENIGSFFKDGLLSFIVSMAYIIPYMIVVWLPLGTLANYLVNQGDVMAVLSILVTLILLVLAFFFAALSLAAQGRFAASGNFNDAFQIKDVFALVKNNLSTYFVLTLAQSVGVLLFLAVGGLACGIGMFATAPMAQMFNGHLIGQAYLKATRADTPSYEPLRTI